MDNTQPTITQAQTLKVEKPLFKKYWWVFGIMGVLLLLILILSLLQSQYVNTALNNNSGDQTPVSNPQANSNSQDQGIDQQGNNDSQIKWSFNGETWASNLIPENCEDDLFIAPVDVTKATNILYPGQVRSGNFKPHGGFRFDGLTNDAVTVTAPADAYVYRASRYIEAGETQYLIDFIVPCGYMYRFDHLLTLSPKYQQIMEKLPAAQVDLSQTTLISDYINVEQGEEVATSIGFQNSSNVAFDFGVYDLRKANEISKDSSWASTYANLKETAYFGICWLEVLPASEASVVNALPGSGTEGKESVYCD